MKTEHLRRVRRLFCVPGVPESVARHNCRAWVASVRLLGRRWRFIDHVPRQEAV